MKKIMNFKEALIAHLQGEKVEARLPGSETAGDWSSLVGKFGEWNFADSWKLCFLDGDFGEYVWEFRLAPRTTLVNGVEVPSPESVAPCGDDYFVPDVWSKHLCSQVTWDDDEHDKQSLERGLVYLNKEDAIARAKAMLITQ